MVRSIEIWSVHKILCMIYENKLDYKPSVQRQFIYNPQEQAQVIKSIEKGLLASSVVIEMISPDNFLLLDGKQRINSIIGFINRAFNVENFYFNDNYRADSPDPQDRYLPPKLKILNSAKDDSDTAKLLNYEFSVILYRDLTREERLTLFNVINTTGKPLNNWELINGRYPTGVLLDMRANYFNERTSTNTSTLDSNFINVKKFSKYFGTSRVNRGELYIKIVEKIYKMEHGDLNDEPYEIIDGIVINTKNYHKLSKFIEDNNDKKFEEFAENLINKLDIFYELFNDLTNLGVLKEPCFNISDTNFYKENHEIIHSRKDILAYLITQYINSDLKNNNDHQMYFEDILLPHLLLIKEGFRNTHDTKRFYSSEEKEKYFYENITFNAETNQVQCKGFMDDLKTEVGCGRWINKDEATVDHIKPWILGGRTSDNNAQILCRRCNSEKGSRIIRNILLEENINND